MVIKKTQKTYIFEILFLFLILGLSPLISSAGYDWTQYGNDYAPLHQAQYSGIFGRFDLGIEDIVSISNGYSSSLDYSYQPLVSDLGTGTQNYVIFPKGNYLYIYDESLNIVEEYFLGVEEIGQIAIADWDDDGYLNDIVGYWQQPNNTLSFRVVTFNSTSESLSLIYENNFTSNLTIGTTGFRCFGNDCYGIVWDYNATIGYSWYFISASNSSFTATECLAGSPYGSRFLNYSFPILPPAKQDVDNDGDDEFLANSISFVAVWDEDGDYEAGWIRNSSTEEISHAVFLRTDGTSSGWKVAISSDYTYTNSICVAGINYGCGVISVKRVQDESEVWHDVVGVMPVSTSDYRTQGIAIRDYNGDNYDDIWIMGGYYKPPIASEKKSDVKIYKGSDGSELFFNSSSGDVGIRFRIGDPFPISAGTTIGRANLDGNFDFIVGSNNTLVIFDPSNNELLYNYTMSGLTTISCIPADVNFDGILDVLCSGKTKTYLFTSNYTNNNAEIQSLAFDPSTTIELDDTLFVYVTATDFEGDTPFYYIHKCKNEDNFSSETTSSVFNCTYDSLGFKNVTAGVRDFFHEGEYDYFSYQILVSATGEICNNNGICESELGETNLNCPNDCATTSQNYTEAEGGIALNTQLVNPDNTQQGLLPDIYYGILGFFSLVLSPSITLIFLIVTILIIIAIAVIIKSIGTKIKNL